ncbi:hypothetical protein [Kitasatospora griseola]|uniref:hypothetical protein n=1 Tax=Kitasatospora griseola TaxID=2064 RepID=UPI003418B298
MDRSVGPVRLEWRANEPACSGEFEIDITVAVGAAGARHASGRVEEQFSMPGPAG